MIRSLLPGPRRAIPALILLLGLAESTPARAATCPQVTLYHRLDGGPGWRLGAALAELDDVDGDGVPDMAVGAPGLPDGGAVLVLSGADFHEIRRHPGNESTPVGEVLAPAGDIDADGVTDLLVGSPRAGVFPAIRRGRVMAYSGSDGHLIREFVGTVNQSEFGRAVAGLGDVNGDGRDDIAVGQPYIDNSVWIYSGLNGSLLARYEPPNNFQIDFGRAVSRVGNVTGDSHAEVLTGAPIGHGTGGRVAGQVGIFPYSPPNFDSSGSTPFMQLGTALTTLGRRGTTGDFAAGGPGATSLVRVYRPDGSTRFELTGTPGTGFGSALAGAGDVDGDGYPDLLIGAPGLDGGNQIGRAALHSGLNGTLLFETFGTPGGFTGQALSSTGDLDGDGGAEFAVGAPWADPPGAPDGGRVEIYSLPNPCISVVLKADPAICSGADIPVLAIVTNCGRLPVSTSVLAPGVPMIPVVLLPGESIENSLSASPTTCTGDGTGHLDVRVQAAYDGCSTATREVSQSLPLICESCGPSNCPRQLSWWERQCLNKGRGREVTAGELAAIAACVDARSSLFDWDTEPGAFCRIIGGLPQESGRDAALREYAAFLANSCAASILHTASPPVRLNLTTPIELPAVPCATLACLATLVDARLLELAHGDPTLPETVAAYDEIRDLCRMVNKGEGIGTTCSASQLVDVPVAPPIVRIDPTPLRPGDRVRLSIDETLPGPLTVDLHDVAGRRIRRLWSGEVSGATSLEFDISGSGARPAAGIYFLRVTSSGPPRSIRLVIVD